MGPGSPGFVTPAPLQMESLLVIGRFYFHTLLMHICVFFTESLTAL